MDDRDSIYKSNVYKIKVLNMTKILSVLFSVLMVSVFAVEKTADVPIVGGFGFKLGEKVNQKMLNQWKAVPEKNQDGKYRVYPANASKDLMFYISLNKKHEIYEIALSVASPDTEKIYITLCQSFSEKYGEVEHYDNVIIYKDPQNPLRTIRLYRSRFLTGVRYTDKKLKGQSQLDI